MSSLSKRFSTIIRQSPSNSAQKTTPNDTQKEKTETSALTTDKSTQKTVTNGDTVTKDVKDSSPKSTPVNSITKEHKSKEQKPKSAPATEKDSKEPSSKVGRSTIRRFSSILRPRSNDSSKKTSKQETAASIAAAIAAKIPRKGAAKDKHVVVVVVGASKGIGLEFVKQFAKQPDTFVIALSRTADKATTLKPIVSASAKDEHNVRAIRVDVTSTRSVNNAIKDIVELTDGRVNLLVNAAGSKGDHNLKVWEIKGPELDDELRNNLVGPITFTNALIPYLKPFKKEDKPAQEAEEEEKEKEQKEPKEETAAQKKEGKSAEQVDKENQAKEETVDENEKKEVKEEQKEAVEETKHQAKEDKPEADAAPSTSDPEPQPPIPGTSEEKSPAEPASESSPSSVSTPRLLPSQPFIVFLAPAEPIHNVSGTVSAEQPWVGSPRTLFLLSRASLQVAIAKYAVGLASKGVGVVAVERHGYNDPGSSITDEQAATAILKLLPNLSVQDNGKLFRTNA